MADGLQLVIIGWPKRLGTWIRMVANETALKPVVLPILLCLVKPSEGHRVDAHPRAIFTYRCRADGFAYFRDSVG